MTDDIHGSMQTYQITWRSGRIETVQAQQVLTPTGFSLRPTNRVTFHGTVDGHWRLILDADFADVLTIRMLYP